MNIFNKSNFLSQLIGYVFIILISWKFIFFVQYIIPRRFQTGIVLTLIYVLAYLVFCELYEFLGSLVGRLSCNKKYYGIVTLLLIIMLPVNIEFSYKVLKLLKYSNESNSSDKIIRYFDDNNAMVKWYALLLHCVYIDTAPVLDWYEKNYIRKGIPIDSDFFPLYEFLMSNNNE